MSQLKEPLFGKSILGRCEVCGELIDFMERNGIKFLVPHDKTKGIFPPRPCSGSHMPVKPENELQI